MADASRRTAGSFESRPPIHVLICRSVGGAVLDDSLPTSASASSGRAAKANTAQQFEDCKLDRKCAWKPSKKDDGVYTIEYQYDLGKQAKAEDKRVVWEVDVKKKRIIPTAQPSDMAFRAVHPRSDLPQ